MAMTDAQTLAEAALLALQNSLRDANWVADAALDALMSEPDGGEDGSPAWLAALAALMARDALVARIAMISPDVGAAVMKQRNESSEQDALH